MNNTPTMDLSLAADLREQVPYVEQYFGVWAMEEGLFRASVSRFEKLDLHLHLQSSTVAEIKAAGGSSAVLVTAGHVAVIELRGMLMKQVSSMTRGTSTMLARRQVRAAAADPEVSAIVLRIDSPGGTVSGTQDLADDVAAAAKKKPVVAYVEDLCASAAYWVASQAQKIYTNASALTGSIGTYGVIYDASAYAAKEGIKVHVVRAGEFKGMGEPGTEVTQKQLEDYQRVVSELNEQFLAGVARGRKMSIEKVRELADGRVHVGATAQTVGLIDGVQSFDATLAQLSKPSGKGTRMSTEGTPISAENKPSEPVAATVDQISAACPGATDAFVVAQLKNKATVEQAKDAWLKQLSETNAALAKERDELQAKNTADAGKEASKKPGVDPVNTGKANADATSWDDPIAAWNAAIQEQMDAGKNKVNATRAVVAEQPELHKAYVAAYTAQYGDKVQRGRK